MSTVPRSRSKTRWEDGTWFSRHSSMPSWSANSYLNSEPMYENGATVELISDYGLSPNGVAQGTKGVVVKQIKSSTLVSVVFFVTASSRAESSQNNE